MAERRRSLGGQQSSEVGLQQRPCGIISVLHVGAFRGIVLTGDSAMGRREVVMPQAVVQAAYSGESWFLIGHSRGFSPPRAARPRPNYHGTPSRNRPRCNTMTAKLSVHAHVGILHQCSERKITPDSPTVCTSAVGCRHVRECTRVQGGPTVRTRLWARPDTQGSS